MHTTRSRSNNWTDDLKICKNTGKGYSINQIYREDGNPQEAHPYEDCSCHYELNSTTSIYAIFDGHAAETLGELSAQSFCDQLIAEINFAQLTLDRTDDQIREVIKQAFASTERFYMKFIDTYLVRRMVLQDRLPTDYHLYDSYHQYTSLVDEIKSINSKLSTGAASAVALIHNKRLYVANVGTCRVLLAQTDTNSVLKVVQLSVDHDLRNEDELLRLVQLGVDTQRLQKVNKLANQPNTRCFGNYLVKGGYKECADLNSALQEPVIAEPDITGGIQLDDTCRFLLLMSSELYRIIEEATGTNQVNKYIATWVVEQFREQSTLTGVAQAVVDKAVRLHHDWAMSSPPSAMKREDITLVLRNFNYLLPNGNRSPSVTRTMGTTLTPSFNSTTSSSSSTISHVDESEVRSEDRVKAYCDLAPLQRKLDEAQQNGTLPAWFNDF